MGYIKEPKGVDLIIPPSNLSKKQFEEISDFIRKHKEKNKKAIEKAKLKLNGII